MAFEVSVAPMIGVSTPEYRRFMRILSPNSKVFTEMIVDTSLIHMTSCVLERKIGLPSPQCILQIGGSCPKSVSHAAKRAAMLGYTSLNLNCGCPSDRVQSGSFGALLMKDPHLIASIVQSVYKETGVIMSVKCRTGLDEVESYEEFRKMVKIISRNSVCKTFYVHARKCLLNGLSPAENRRIPPLTHEYVFQLKKDLPYLNIILNGGIKDISYISSITDKVDGVMLGRKAMDDPFFFTQIESVVFSAPALTRAEAVKRYLNSIPASDKRQLFFDLDSKLSPAKESISQKTLAHNPNSPSNIWIDLDGTSVYLCRHADLKPIEPILFGLRGCKKYKQCLSSLVHGRVPVADVFSRIEQFLHQDKAID